jgi:hypothetical protein
MNKENLFYIVFCAVIVKSTLFMLTWEQVGLLLGILIYFAYNKYLESKVVKEHTDFGDKLSKMEKDLNNKLEFVDNKINDVKTKINFTLTRKP